MKKSMTFSRMLILLLVVTVILAGCGSGNNAGSSNASGTEKEQTGQTTGGSSSSEPDKQEPPTEISIMSTFFSQEPPTDDNVVIKEVEKRTNTKLKITWVSNNNYNDKANVTLASGQIPDLILILNPHAAQVAGMVEQGAFWNLTEYLPAYENLMTFPEESWLFTKSRDGGNYGIPRVRPTEGNGYLYFRKDWLEKVDMELPRTFDEIFDVWTAFTELDPDNNGKNDTFGFAAHVRETFMGGFTWVENAFNKSNGEWKEQDGKLVNINLEPAMRDALLWLNKAYKAGLIPSDFAVMQQSQAQDLVRTGRAGSYFDTVGSAYGYELDVKKNTPEGEFAVLPYIEGPQGAYAQRDTGSYGVFMIPKSVPEEKMKKILEFMDYGASQEGSDLASFGLEGVHYNEVDGFKEPTEQAAKDNVSQGAFGQIFGAYDKYMRAHQAGIPKEVYERNKQIIDEGSEVSVANVGTGLFSEISQTLGNDYAKKITDVKVQVIMGRQDIASWDKLVEELKNDANFQKMIEEINESYQQRLGNN